MDKKELRSSIFRHLDGIVTAPVIHSLQKKEIIDFILNSKKITLKEISEKIESNEGYLNVALRIIASQGFIDYQLNNSNDEVILEANQNTPFLLKYASLYEKVNLYLKESTNSVFQKFESGSFENLALQEL